jgi:uncharacterized repeat protein (TIGR01451 family)
MFTSIAHALRKFFPWAIVLCLGLSVTTWATDNQATGDVAGVDPDLGDSNVFALNTQTLALIKRAFLANGTPLLTGTTLPKGTVVKFLVYINNNTAFPVSDVSAQDVLAAGFAYTAGTTKVDNLVPNCGLVACTAIEEAAIYAAVNATAAKTDAIDGDVVSYNGGTQTIDAGNQSVANLQLDVAASKVWAMLFTVTMQ